MGRERVGRERVGRERVRRERVGRERVRRERVGRGGFTQSSCRYHFTCLIHETSPWKKGRPICHAKLPTAQDSFQPINHVLSKDRTT